MMPLARSTPGLFRPSIHQIVSSKRRATMVNYHDPSTIAQDTCVCAFLSCVILKPDLVFETGVLVRLWHVANGFFM